jgi:hypothetical protein
MSRVSQSQRQRTQNDPLVLGTFSQTSLRELTGTLGPLTKVVGRKDTNQYSNGGIGGGTYNHWFQVNVTTPCWLITKKGGPRPNYIQISAYDLNLGPIQGRMIFQEDSVDDSFGYSIPHHPYNDHVMGAASDRYNTFNPNSLDKGDDLYFTLERGSYLICVSTTRNELLNYTLGVVVEFPQEEMLLLLEDLDNSFLATETGLDTGNTITIGPVFNTNYTIPSGFNAYTLLTATIGTGVTVTVSNDSTWLVGYVNSLLGGDFFIIEPSDSYDFNSVHEHSRTDWLAAWRRERSPEDSLPVLFDSLITNS